MSEPNIQARQRQICKKHNVEFCPAPPDSKLGIALNVREGLVPIHGLRHPPERGTCGWYIWAGEYSEDSDFFVPLHVSHLNEWCSSVEKYLGLPPGWRFLLADDYEDIWYDETLLQI